MSAIRGVPALRWLVYLGGPSTWVLAIKDGGLVIETTADSPRPARDPWRAQAQ